MDEWIAKYRESTKLAEKTVDVLTGFNANIDVIHQVSELGYDLSTVEPKLVERLSSKEELKSSIKHCMETNENHEIDINGLELELEGSESIGGQAGIISNFLASTGDGVIFYTPLLSGELAAEINEKVLYPTTEDGEFMLKNVRDCSNTSRIKRNHIFEFDRNGKTGRLIASDTLKGFGPYFMEEIEDELELIQENIDCAILSGFHDIEGNKEAKLKKAARQLRQIEKPVHLEYVDRNRELTQLIVERVLPEVDSLGIDETEFSGLTEILDLESIGGEEVNLGEAFSAAQSIIEKFELQRIHLHTYRYHLTVTPESYPRSKKKIQRSMLYGELAAIKAADTGEIPGKEEIRKFDMEDKEINGLEELEDFGEFLSIPGFETSGKAEIDGFNAVAIPTIIHRDPERTVGMGDIISSAAFSSEFS